MRTSSGKQSRRRRLLVWAAGILLGLTVLFVAILPWVARKVIISQASKILGREVTLESVSINPFKASVRLKDLRVKEKDGSPLVGFEELYVDVNSLSVFGDAWHVDELRIVRPQARVILNKDGSINLLAMLPKSAEPAAAKKDEHSKKASPAKPVHITSLFITEASANLTDNVPDEPFEGVFGPLSLELHDIGTVPNRAGQGGLTIRSSIGELFSWKGQMEVAKLRSSGTLSISKLRLSSLRPYFIPVVGFRFQSGDVSFTTDYTIDLSGEPKVDTSKGSLVVENVAMVAVQASEPFAKLERLEVNGIAASVQDHSASVAEVKLVKPFLSAVRRADNSIDVLGFVEAKMHALPHVKFQDLSPETPTAPAAPWTVRVPEVQVADAHFHVTDETVSPAARLDVDGLGLTVKGFQMPGNPVLEVAGSTWLQSSGSFTWNGKATLSPVTADLNLKLEDLPLAGFAAYLKPFIDAELSKGELTVVGNASLSLADTKAPKASWRGGVALKNLALAGPKQDPKVYTNPRMTLGLLSIEGIQASTEPLSASVERILVREPKLHATVLPDKTIDWLKLLKKQPAPAAPAPAVAVATEKPPLPPVRIDRVDIEGLSFKVDDYTDGLSANPTFGLLLDGNIAGLSSEQLSHAEVDLHGEFTGAPLAITGQVNPLSKDLYSQLSIRCGGYELPSASPYAERYIGYGISQGKLVLDLKYRLSESMLEAENHIVLDRFYLGEEKPSPEAVKLPYKLGLALLRDRNGKIDIDMPIRGNLKDPDFKYGKFVWQTVGNLLVKAAASPFKLLGSLVGSSADLSQVEFVAGDAALTPEILQRLDALGKALTERPALHLEILAQKATPSDRQALRERALDRQLQELRLKELAGKPEAPANASLVQLSPEESSRLVAALYVERFREEIMAASLAAQQDAAKAAGKPVPTKPVAASKAPKVVKPEQTRSWVRNVSLFFRDLFSPAGSMVAEAKPKAPAANAPAPQVAVSMPPGVKAPTIEEMRARLIEGIEPAAEDLRRLSARRALGVKNYLEDTRKIDATRVFVVGSEAEKDATAAEPLVKFRLN